MILIHGLNRFFENYASSLWYYIASIIITPLKMVMCFCQHTIIPRFKSWIRKVVMEEEDEKGTLKGRPSLAEEAAVAAKAAAAAAVDVARASQEMLASKTEGLLVKFSALILKQFLLLVFQCITPC